MIPEGMTRACAVSIMNACLHELHVVWVIMRASSESAWRLESAAQQFGARATSLETAVAPIQHRRESACSLSTLVLYHLLFSALAVETGDRSCVLACALHTAVSSWPAHTLFITHSGWTVASASVPNRGTETNRSCFSVHSHLRLDPAAVAEAEQRVMTDVDT